MLTRTLGTQGLTVSALGLGCMGMSDFYGPTDRSESTATIPVGRYGRPDEYGDAVGNR